jgi:hypothetical protein
VEASKTFFKESKMLMNRSKYPYLKDSLRTVYKSQITNSKISDEKTEFYPEKIQTMYLDRILNFKRNSKEFVTVFIKNKQPYLIVYMKLRIRQCCKSLI